MVGGWSLHSSQPSASNCPRVPRRGCCSPQILGVKKPSGRGGIGVCAPHSVTAAGGHVLMVLSHWAVSFRVPDWPWGRFSVALCPSLAVLSSLCGRQPPVWVSGPSWAGGQCTGDGRGVLREGGGTRDRGKYRLWLYPAVASGEGGIRRGTVSGASPAGPRERAPGPQATCRRLCRCPGAAMTQDHRWLCPLTSWRLELCSGSRLRVRGWLSLEAPEIGLCPALSSFWGACHVPGQQRSVRKAAGTGGSEPKSSRPRTEREQLSVM